jgi:hypothetical protein
VADRDETTPGHDEETDRGEHPPGDRVPESEEAKEELVEETIDESFPASDPPSYWGRETSDEGSEREGED